MSDICLVHGVLSDISLFRTTCVTCEVQIFVSIRFTKCNKPLPINLYEMYFGDFYDFSETKT